MTRIESERRKIGINKAQLADHLGVSGSAVSQWENEGKQPSAKNYAKMAKLFGVSVDYLLSLHFPQPRETVSGNVHLRVED